jgi:hypothetical protein
MTYVIRKTPNKQGYIKARFKTKRNAKKQLKKLRKTRKSLYNKKHKMTGGDPSQAKINKASNKYKAIAFELNNHKITQEIQHKNDTRNVTTFVKKFEFKGVSTLFSFFPKRLHFSAIIKCAQCDIIETITSNPNYTSLTFSEITPLEGNNDAYLSSLTTPLIKRTAAKYVNAKEGDITITGDLYKWDQNETNFLLALGDFVVLEDEWVDNDHLHTWIDSGTDAPTTDIKRPKQSIDFDDLKQGEDVNFADT